VQLQVLGFDDPNFQGEILGELQRLRNDDRVRVIGTLASKCREACHVMRPARTRAEGR
jgi:hypothetical protein